MATTTKKPAAKAPAKPVTKKPSISAAHKADIQAITDKMYQLSREYDCHVFDAAVAELNKKLNHPIVRPTERLRTGVSFDITFDGVVESTNSWGGCTSPTPPTLSDEQREFIGVAVAKALKGGLPDTYEVDEIYCNPFPYCYQRIAESQQQHGTAEG